MPMLVRTPEDIFRAEKKDLYVIHGKESKDHFGLSARDDKEGAAGLKVIRAWIEDHLPGTRMELLGPSEHSGIITGGVGGKLRVDFSEAGLEKFCAAWEDENGGSLDPRFQCYLYPYDKWYQEHGRFVPTREKPKKAGIAVWWYTPGGFVYHQLGAKEARSRKAHPAHPRDIWMHAQERWPDMSSLDPEFLAHGRVYATDKGKWLVAVTLPLPFPGARPSHIPTENQIRDWFNLPEDTEVAQDDF